MSSQRKPSFYNPCVVQHGEFVVEQRDEFAFAVLEPNPDAGKINASYSGKRLTVCTTDGVEDAVRIAIGLFLLAKREAA